MDEQEPQETGEEIVRCENCGAQVRSKATECVQRLYQGVPFAELWCRKCTGAVDENTRYVLGTPEDARGTAELGLGT